ncbi:MAG TPA: hypothetical protein VN965_02965 [Candidatus Dormibacteraeota bacterium]|jgi:hypothetical protein|nr:hypothetical protein [Candidatus Dormibacteraeota bacterium]
MRRIGYALFVLAGLSVVIALVSFGFAGSASTGTRTRAVVYGIVNFGFAVVNAVLGLALVAGSRAR